MPSACTCSRGFSPLVSSVRSVFVDKPSSHPPSCSCGEHSEQFAVSPVVPHLGHQSHRLLGKYGPRVASAKFGREGKPVYRDSLWLVSRVLGIAPVLSIALNACVATKASDATDDPQSVINTYMTLRMVSAGILLRASAAFV